MLIVGPVQGQTAILRFLLNRPAATPSDVRDQLEQFAVPEMTPSPVVGCIETVELIYARRADLPLELISLGADLAEMIARVPFQMGIGPTGEPGRAQSIFQVLSSAIGAAGQGEIPELVEPEPKAEYVLATSE